MVVKTATLALSANHATTIADLVAQLPGTVDGGGKRKADEISEVYYINSDDCFDYVIGSAAVVERLWSVARYILTTNRSSLSPVLFEALLFLRSNRTLWDVRTSAEGASCSKRGPEKRPVEKEIGQGGRGRW